MALQFEYDIFITRKLAAWAENHWEPGQDFLDYWYHLFLSHTKVLIDEPDKGNLASFGVPRWKNDFEIYVDKFSPKIGESFTGEVRCWFATYSQYLVYALQMPSKAIAVHYGKEMFIWLMEHYGQFHTFGSNLFIQHFIQKWGLPSHLSKPHPF